VGQRDVYAQAPAETPEWNETECKDFKLQLHKDSNVQCGYVTVPLRHADPDGAKIQLAVVTFGGIDTSSELDPLFMAQGGPGGSTIKTYAQQFINDPKSRPTANRDIVLWDQRGNPLFKAGLALPRSLASRFAGRLSRQ